jgi:alpha-beta hydrolase superfamily lysophospholipase
MILPEGYEDIKKRITSVILSAPAIVLPQKPNCVATNVLLLLTKLGPSLKLLKGDPYMHSRIKAFADYYAKLEDSATQLPLKLLKEILMMTIFLEENLNKVDFPMLLTHGELDETVSIKGSEMLFATNSNTDKKYVIYQKAKHALIHEYTLLEVNQLVTDWIDSHCNTVVVEQDIIEQELRKEENTMDTQL